MKVKLLQEIQKHLQKVLGLSFAYGTFKLAYSIVREGEVISYVDLIFKTLEYAFVMPINYAVDCTMLAICLAPKMLLGEKESVNYLMDHIHLGPYNIGNHPRYKEFAYGPGYNRDQVHNDSLDAMIYIEKNKNENWEIPMEELEVAAERDAEAVHIWRLQYAQALYNCALNDVGNIILPKQLLAMQRVQQRLEYEHFMYLMMLWNSEWNKTEVPLEGPDWNKRLHAIQVHHEYAIFSKNRNYDWEHWTVMAQNFRKFSNATIPIRYILFKYDLCSEKPFLIKELK